VKEHWHQEIVAPWCTVVMGVRPALGAPALNLRQQMAYKKCYTFPNEKPRIPIILLI